MDEYPAYLAELRSHARELGAALKRIDQELDRMEDGQEQYPYFHARDPKDGTYEFLLEFKFDGEKRHYFFACHKGGAFPREEKR